MKKRINPSSNTGKIMSMDMLEKPLKSIFKECYQCDLLREAMKNSNYDRGEMRFDCESCQDVYKFDAIIESMRNQLKYLRQKNRLESFDKNKGTGKKATRKKQYGHAVHQLRADGKKLDEIASIIGIARSTVQLILKDSPPPAPMKQRKKNK